MKKFNNSLIRSPWIFLTYLTCVFFLLSSLLVSCSSKSDSPYEISPEERIWLAQFFNDIMLFEHGIYTLWGSKSMTIIVIDQHSEHEVKAAFDNLSDKEKDEYFFVDGYSLPSTWEKWEAISHRFPTSRYMLFKTELFQEPNTTYILFVDPLKTAVALQDHYEIFKQTVGYDFHPLEVALDIKNNHSDFWSKIKGHSHLWGILFGFGKFNSYVFHWKFFDHPSSIENYCQHIKCISNNEPMKGHVNIDNFETPSFFSFNPLDDMYEKYKREKEAIQQIYKGQDFLDLTLQKLTE